MSRRSDREGVAWPRRHFDGDGDPIAGRAWVERVNTSAGQQPPWPRRVIRTPGLMAHLREPTVMLPGSTDAETRRWVRRTMRAVLCRREPVALPGGGR